MSNGFDISTTPLPIEIPTTMLVGSPGMLFVEPCLVCGLCYTYNNICISSCGCTYHHFNVGVLLESGGTSCVKPICGKMLEFAWFKSIGFKHITVQLKRAKLERGYNVVTRSGKRSATRSATFSIQHCKLFFTLLSDFELLCRHGF
jgi:hypothetical protein